MTTMSVLGTMSAASASTMTVASPNTFSRQLTATGNAIVSGTSINLTAATSSPAGNFLTFTLPSGMTFAASPSVAFTSGATGGLSVATGGSGAQSIVYSTTGTFSNGSTLTLSGLQIAGLQTYISTNSTAGSFNITGTFPNDALQTSTATIATITDAASAAGAAGAGQTIDVSSGGVKFISGTANALFIPLGTVTFANDAATVPNDIAGQTAVSMSAQGGNIVVTGNLSGLSTVYAIATAVATTCATAAPSGAFTATPGATAATLTGLSVSTFQMCAIANGSTILTNGTITVRPSITLSSNATLTGTTTGNAVTYSGNVRTMAYYVGATGGYGSYAYAVNGGTTAATSLVSVRRSDGASATGSLASLAAGASALYGAADINTAVGSSFLVDASSRAQVTFLFSTTSVNITGLLLNPGGTVTGMGQQFSN